MADTIVKTSDLTPGWLAARYLFDMKSRALRLEQKFIASLPQGKKLRLVDLGTGTGANFFYLSKRIPNPQHWLLTEQDHDLLQSIPQCIDQFSALYEPPAAASWMERLESGEISYEIIAGDIFTSCQNFLKLPCDAITANAVFDLNSEDQFRSLIRSILSSPSASAPLYFTLHLDGQLSLNPSDIHDRLVCNRYQQHMARKQKFGSAMAANAANLMRQIMSAEGYQVQACSSPWEISGEHENFLQENLSFMKSALLDGSKLDEQEILTAWFQKRERQIARGELEMVIGHSDLLARFS